MESLLVGLDGLLADLLPNESQIESRKQSEVWIHETLNNGVSSKSFVIGAGLNGLLLPTESMEITQVFPKNQAVNWAVRTNELLVAEAAKLQLTKPSAVEIDDITVSVGNNTLQSVINETHFTFTPNNIRSMFFSVIVEEINNIVGQEGLYKRSVLLLKAWLAYESRKYTYQGKYCLTLCCLFSLPLYSFFRHLHTRSCLCHCHVDLLHTIYFLLFTVYSAST